jgi:hypothetical protein
LAGNLKFRSSGLSTKIRGNVVNDVTNDEEGFWRDSLLSAGVDSGRCASCTNLILKHRNKKGEQFKSEIGAKDDLGGDRDSGHFGIGCLPSCSSGSRKLLGAKSSKLLPQQQQQQQTLQQANNWCCGVGVIASTVKQKTKKLE